MQISSFSVSTQARSELLRVESEPLPQSAQATPPPVSIGKSERVSISAAALREALSIDSPSVDEEMSEISPELRLLMRFIEALTGEKVKIYGLKPEGSEDAAAEPSAEPARGIDGNASSSSSAVAGASSPTAGPRLVVEYSSWNYEARGAVVLSDGTKMAFSISASRSSLYAGLEAPSAPKDPLVLSLDGGPVSVGPGGTLVPGKAAWLAIEKSDGLLALFGPSSGDGFAELTRLDSDGNGWIDAGDADFSKLRLVDSMDGSGSRKLSDAGVGAMFLGSLPTPFAHRDGANVFARDVASSFWLSESGKASLLQRVDVSA